MKSILTSSPMKNQDPFVQLTPFQRSQVVELREVAKLCYERGWTWCTAGNFSVRGTQDTVWMSPSGISKRDINIDGFVPMSLSTGKPYSNEKGTPSGEASVHLEIYKCISDAKTVVHSHPPRFAALSKGKREIVFQGHEMLKALGISDHQTPLKISFTPNPTPQEMLKLKLGQEHLNLNIRAVVLEGHGVYAWGKSPLEALVVLEVLEYLCSQQVK